MRAKTPIERAVATYCPDWPTSPIHRSDLARVNPETLGSGTSPEFAFHYIDITSVTTGTINWDSVAHLTFAAAPSRARRVVRAGDTMICTVRPLLMSHASLETGGRGATVCSTGFAVVRSAGALRPGFLKHLPFAEQVTRQLIAWQCGTNYPAVNERDVRCLSVPVPPPDEQDAIARMLDAVDTTLERTRAAVKRARDLRVSIIHETLRRGTGNEAQRKSAAGLIPESWAAETLGGHLADGPTNGVYRPESDYAAHGTRIIRIDDFDEGRFKNIDALRRVVVEPIIARRYAVTRDDILINRVNSMSHIGKATLVPPLEETTIFESNVMRVRCGPRLLPAFLNIVLCSDVARKHWLARAKPAVNQASINQRDLRDLPVPIPKRSGEQADIVALVSAAERQVDALRDVLATQQTLKLALLHDLLTGRVRVADVAKVAAS